MTASIGDIVFIRPNDKKAIYGNLANSLSAIEPPLWAALLAAHLRQQGFVVAIRDAEVENESPVDTARFVAENPARLVCVVTTGSNLSASTWKMQGARELITELRRHTPNLPILLWGLHPSALPEQSLREEAADYLIVGEGFAALPTLLTRLRAAEGEPPLEKLVIPSLWVRHGEQIVSQPREPMWRNLDALPMPAWDLLPMARYRAHNWHAFDDLEKRSPYGVIYTSLGCPYDCSFCALKTLTGASSVRYRSPTLVVEEIVHQAKTYGIRHFKVLDECFVLNKRHVSAICEGLIASGLELNLWAYARINTVSPELLALMHRAGIRWLAYGIESGNAKVLNGVDKHGYNLETIRTVIAETKAAGIYIVGNFIFGLPDDDLDSMRDTLALAQELNCEYTNFYVTMAYPGSRLYSEARERGTRLPSTWVGYSQFSEDTLPLPTKKLTGPEVLRFRDEAFREFHSHPAYFRMLAETFGSAVVKHFQDEVLSKSIRRRSLLSTSAPS